MVRVFTIRAFIQYVRWYLPVHNCFVVVACVTYLHIRCDLLLHVQELRVNQENFAVVLFSPKRRRKECSSNFDLWQQTNIGENETLSKGWKNREFLNGEIILIYSVMQWKCYYWK